jgi:hypothetical protein
MNLSTDTHLFPDGVARSHDEKIRNELLTPLTTDAVEVWMVYQV